VIVIEKVGWFDVPVEYASFVDVMQCLKQTMKVVADIANHEVTVV
jgi:hypothetical protein